jgi:hypothetical protein
MPILDLYRSNNSHILGLSLKQVIALCGDGELKDNSLSVQELREYLSYIKSEKLFEYIDACLNDKIDKGGLVLQDLINELGRRLEYQVSNGLYQGIAGQSGHDGLWSQPNKHSFIVEVKTTDAYRINLDKVAAYRAKLISDGALAIKSSILIVVGRQDTGDLEAQIRGSKHAWDIRLISTDALIKLVRLKESAEESTTEKIHELLQPFEYTRLDKIVDIAFTAAQEREENSTLELPDADKEQDLSAQTSHRERVAYSPSPGIDVVRNKILDTYKKQKSVELVRKSKVMFWTPDSDHKHRVACTISKSYSGGQSQYYWYAFHNEWKLFLEGAREAYFILGCLDRSEAFVLPLSWINTKLPSLNTTDRPDGKSFWHIHLRADDMKSPLFLCLAGRTEEVSLEDYRLEL